MSEFSQNFEEGEALGDDLAAPVELEDRALDDIEENPDDLAGEEVEGEYDPEYEEDES